MQLSKPKEMNSLGLFSSTLKLFILTIYLG
jgi:hypothetical protein